MLLKPRQNRGKRELRKCRCGAEALWRREVMHKIANFKDNYSFNARSPLRLQVPSVLFMQKKRLYPILRIQSFLVRVTGRRSLRDLHCLPTQCLRIRYPAAHLLTAKQSPGLFRLTLAALLGFKSRLVFLGKKRDCTQFFGYSLPWCE